MSLLEKIRVTQAFLESKGIEKPEFGLILGSGLGELAEEVEDAVVIDYADIPNWGQSTVVGHAGVSDAALYHQTGTARHIDEGTD